MKNRERDEQVMIPDEAAAFIKVRAGTLASWRHRNIGPAYRKVGAAIFYERAALEKFLRDAHVTPKQSYSKWYLKEAMSA